MADTIQSTVPEIYLDPLGLKKLANYLRSADGIKIRDGVEHEKRVQYFKGDRLVHCLLHPKKWPHSLPAITEPGVAQSIGALLIKHQYIHRSEKNEEKKGFLHISKRQIFEENGYYTWMFHGSMMWSNVATIAIVVLVILFTLLPIWPALAKRLLWYFAVTFLLISFSFLLLRGIIFVLLWIVGYDFWMFPRLFDESLGVLDSFKPIYTFEKGATGQGYYRVGLLIILAAFVAWASTQPTEFDGFLETQKQFVEDLYSGNFLSDVAAHKEHLDNLDRHKRFPKIDQLLREMEEDEREQEEAGTETETGIDHDHHEKDHDHDHTIDETRLDELLSDSHEEQEEEQETNIVSENKFHDHTHETMEDNHNERMDNIPDVDEEKHPSEYEHDDHHSDL
jgi:translocation protein SEC62